MKSHYLLVFTISCFLLSCTANNSDIALPPTAFEASNGLETETYQSGMAYWKLLDQKYKALKLLTYGQTDAGKPLHLAVISPEGNFTPESVKENGSAIILINNAIHPGEPDGVDASLLMCKELLSKDDAELKNTLGNTVIAIIPFYNIGGALNRNSTTRANQNGPVSYGFRGNAQNYDLNRDFIKSDTRNAESFAKLFTEWSPDVMVDTHVSNGADYQYAITCLDTQPDKLGDILGGYLREEFTPALFNYMEANGHIMTPYVNVWGSIPDSGWVQFMDHPRYSTGYAALHHTLGFMTETHMLKPFKQRVEATKAFLEGVVEYVSQNGTAIRQLRKRAIAQSMKAESWPLTWKNNAEQWDTLLFKGYEASFPISEVTGKKRLFYDREKLFEKPVHLFNHFQADVEVEVPSAYLIPQAWSKVIDRLQWNGVEMEVLKEEQSFEGSYYLIEDYQTRSRAYEGHYPHSNVQVSEVEATLQGKAGDILVKTDQPKRRFILETLEPQAVDSYFNWNFFDIILQRKEGFSPYVFEDKAAEILAGNPKLKQEFEAKKQEDPNFSQNPYLQLQFIYENSELAEKAYMRYPIGRVDWFLAFADAWSAKTHSPN